MVARGDLGVEMNPWDVPVLQKRIVETCKTMGKPVVRAQFALYALFGLPVYVFAFLFLFLFCLWTSVCE